MMLWKRKSSLVFGLSLLIASVVWSQMGMYLAHLLFGVNLKMNFFKLCLSLFRDNSLYYFMMIFLLNTVIVYSIMITLVNVVQQYVRSTKFKSKIMSLRNDYLTKHLIEEFGLQHQDLIVIDHNQSMAFTLGFRNPLIVLSSGLVELLDRDELEAVIEHEAFHKNNHDSMKIFILQVISRALWFIPLTKWSYQNCTIMSELLADEYAIRKTGSELGLSSALLKLIKVSFTNQAAPAMTHFAEVSVNFRLQQLLHPQRSIPVKLGMTSIVISIHMLLLLMGVIVLAIA
ncbi:M56 family metallopeptidase [Cohnella sp. WQ 127256]|uniref:M56 family metallopeptidase n=1 Tax=Cohnella sp. WQ 127256 TaxID=2938790 RepID=UPI0021193A28|nr:M56 family metallopeptidase [Cohnella sp. WQ 127256]